MNMLGLKNKPSFTIDDAFETDGEDFIKTYYGSTSENAPLKKNSKINNVRKSDVMVRIDDPSKGRHVRLKPADDAFSKDSDSLIHSDAFPAEKFDSRMLWWKHPKVRENWKIMLAALGLLIIGIGLLTTGIIVLISPEMGVQSFVFFIAGAICFIPGAYHVVYVYCAVKGRRGYNFHNLPLFN